MQQTAVLNEAAVPADPAAPQRKPGLGHRAAQGLLMMLAQNAVARLSGVVSQLALAALLVPADFGLISLAMTVSGIATVLLNIGIEDVLLQRERRLVLWTGAGFWISLGLSCVAAAAVVLIGPLAAGVYHAPSLPGMLATLALSMPLGALGAVPSMLLRYRLRFGALAAYGSVEIVAQATLTVLLAATGWGPYSFVIPVPLTSAARSLVFWRMARPEIRYRIQWRRWRPVLASTGATFGSRLLIALMNQGDYMVLGLMASHAVLGQYYFGFRLAAQPLWVLAGNFANVLLPALVQLKSEPLRQGEAAMRAATLLSYCVMPCAVIQAALAGPLLTFFFGHKWAQAVPVIQWLSIGLALDAVSWVAGALQSARGEFGVTFRWILLQTPVFFIFVWIGSTLDQAVGVAVAVAAFYAVTQPLFVVAAFRPVGIGIWQIACVYLVPGALAAVAAVTGLGLALCPPFAAHALTRAFAIGAAGFIVYAGLVRLFAPAIARDLAARFLGALKRRTA